MSNTPRDTALATVVALVVLVLVACAPSPSAPPEVTDGPGGSGVVAAEPEGLNPENVTADTACELAALSPTLVGLDVVGTSVSTQFTLDLSYCELRFQAPEFVDSGVSVRVLTAADVALTAGTDPTVSGSTLVSLPDVGVDGHFLALGPGVDPTANPTSGSIVAARGDLGVSVSWGTGPVIPFDAFKQITRELLDALE